MAGSKIKKQSTWIDMTAMVDLNFLILSFFIMATKFKPPAPVEINPPSSVSTEKIEEQDALLMEFDKTGRVFFTMNVKDQNDKGLKLQLIQRVNDLKKLGLSPSEMQRFAQNATIGTPFNSLKSLLALPADQAKGVHQVGIPVDSANNELSVWVRSGIEVFQGHQVNYFIKGDNNAKYTAFKGVIDALRANEQFKYKLITSLESVPVGTELYKTRQSRSDHSTARTPSSPPQEAAL